MRDSVSINAFQRDLKNKLLQDYWILTGHRWWPPGPTCRCCNRWAQSWPLQEPQTQGCRTKSGEEMIFILHHLWLLLHSQPLLHPISSSLTCSFFMASNLLARPKSMILILFPDLVKHRMFSGWKWSGQGQSVWQMGDGVASKVFFKFIYYYFFFKSWFALVRLRWSILCNLDLFLGLESICL